jgi:hypothetical protein
LGSREQGRPTSRAKRDRRLGVLNIDQTFDGALCRRMKADQGVDMTMNFYQTAWHRELGFIPDYPVIDRTHFWSFFFKDGIPTVPERWVES